MRVPKNIIQVGKYTSGNEFVEEKTNKPYQGHYYELNGSLYTGIEYSMNAVKIIKKQDQNQLYNGSNTALFSLISGITSQQLAVPSINSISNSKRDDLPPINQSASPTPPTSTQFFIQKINVNPIIIKEVDEKSYISVRGNPLYKTTFIGVYNGVDQNLDKAEAQMPGLKTFLSV
jgi:hypothetical protein